MLLEDQIRALGNESENDFVFIVTRLALSQRPPDLADFPALRLSSEQRAEYSSMDRPAAIARSQAWLSA